MKTLLSKIQIKINERVYLKDPESSPLGRKIVRQSTLLIDEIGLENFTFKKLAKEIGSTEASVYRYFENKHKLLIYLVSWYWNWMEYQLVFQTSNLECAEKVLETALATLAKPLEIDNQYDSIDAKALHRIVVSESAKAYLTKEVDSDNKEGYFASYKRLTHRVADMILKLKPNYKYPNALVSIIMESSHQQSYFAKHFPSLTEVRGDDNEKTLIEFLTDLVFNALKVERSK
ncbi:TetR/AcrR family transcriptional regulator [Bernardetia sp.]|uniref:TetR/AcrR family transcriptional regulator n=1 Tax=Bernardetia sp. TaxID=1937974 RepID=UPI0025C3088D|nr:TetR/AcrR family transcriptional regulator [Bernardetia sp.]